MRQLYWMVLCVLIVACEAKDGTAPKVEIAPPPPPPLKVENAPPAPPPLREPHWQIKVTRIGHSVVTHLSVVHETKIVKKSDADGGAATGAGIGAGAAILLGGPVVWAAVAGAAIGSHSGSQDYETVQISKPISCSFSVVVNKLALSFTQDKQRPYYPYFPETWQKCLAIKDGMPVIVYKWQYLKDGVLQQDSFIYVWEIGTVEGPLI